MNPSATIPETVEPDLKDDPANDYGADEEQLEGETNQRFLLFNLVPSWLVSLVMHVALIVILAVVMMPRKQEIQVSFQAADVSGDQLDVMDVDFSALELESNALETSEIEPTEPTAELIEPTLAPLEAATNPLEAIGSMNDLAPLGDTALGSLSPSASSETANRSADMRDRMLRKYGGTPASEQSVALALEWLVAHQLPDGSWSFDHTIGGGPRSKKDPGSAVDARFGATGLALLPFLANGQTHLVGKHKDTVRRGLEFLVIHGDRSNGYMSFWDEDGTMYSHGLCAIVICEALTMSQDQSLREIAQGCIYYIDYAQDPRGGGWQYAPQQPGDTSVAGWQVMAMKSARYAGLKINPKTIALTEKFLDSVSVKNGTYYGYMDPPKPPDMRDRGRTAVGILCRMYMNWPKDHPSIVEAVQWLSEIGPSPEDNERKRENAINMYYNYYATQVMMQYGGEAWDAWNAELRDFLVQSQSTDGAEKGSWIFSSGELGIERGGRLYCTAMACLTLEVYYRYLPLYEDKAFEEDFPLD